VGIAVGLCGAGRSFGGCIAVSIYLTILGSWIPEELPPAIAGAVSSSGLSASTTSALIALLMSGNVTGAAGLPGMTDAILQQAIAGMNLGYQRCFKVVYLSTLGFGVFGILAAYFVLDASHHFTNHTAVSLSRGEDEILEEKV
jgi:hypothetical protein